MVSAIGGLKKIKICEAEYGGLFSRIFLTSIVSICNWKSNKEMSLTAKIYF